MNFKNFFKKDELKLLWPFYVEALILGMLYIAPAFEMIYLVGIGLSLTQIGTLLSALALAGLLFEIPTGAVADVFGRKFSTILGQIMLGLSMILIFFFTDFYVLLGLYFFKGFAYTFISGAEESWIVNLLNYKKKKKLVQEFYVKRQSFVNTSMVVSGILGALLVKYLGIGIIWLVTGATSLMTAFAYSFGQEYFRKKKQHITKHAKDVVNCTKKSVAYSLQHHVVFWLMVTSILMVSMHYFSGTLTWFPFLKELGFKEHWFGYLFSASFGIGIFAPYLAKPMLKKAKSHKKFFLIVLSMIFLPLFLVGFTKSMVILVVLLLLFWSASDFFGPIRQAYFQMFVPNKIRATVSSVNGMLRSLTIMFVAPFVGFVADKIGLQRTIFIASFITLLVMLVFYKINEKKVYQEVKLTSSPP